MRTLFLPVRVHRAAAEALPVPDGWARLVVSIKAFHHWEDPRAGLAEVRRALAPGGRVMLADEDFAEGHQHTRFHREAATAAPTHAGSPEVEGWLRELGFDGIRLERVEDEEGVFHHVRYAVARGGNAGPPGAEGGDSNPHGRKPIRPSSARVYLIPPLRQRREPGILLQLPGSEGSSSSSVSGSGSVSSGAGCSTGALAGSSPSTVISEVPGLR